MKDYDKDTIEVEELDDSNLELNPSQLLMRGFKKSQDLLTKDDVNGGILQFIMLSDYLENIAKSTGSISENYEKELKKFKDSLKEEKETIKNFKIAQKKQELIQQEVFNSGVILDKLKL